jgi:cell division protein FtsX
MGHEWVSWLGAFILWVFSGFKKKSFREYFNHNFAFLTGVGFILFIVLIIVLIG